MVKLELRPKFWLVDREFANNCCFDKILIILFAALQPVEDKESNSLANMLKYDGRFDEYSLSKNFEGSEVSNQWFFTFQVNEKKNHNIS
jgi:hypothetical protein